MCLLDKDLNFGALAADLPSVPFSNSEPITKTLWASEMHLIGSEVWWKTPNEYITSNFLSSKLKS